MTVGVPTPGPKRDGETLSLFSSGGVGGRGLEGGGGLSNFTAGSTLAASHKASFTGTVDRGIAATFGKPRCDEAAAGSEARKSTAPTMSSRRSFRLKALGQASFVQ